jgi:hypothetical protein
VAADVAPRARDGLQVIRRLAADGQLAQPLQPGRHQLGGVRGEDGEQPGQVGAVPVAGQVGLAEPDQAGAERGPVRAAEHHAQREAAVGVQQVGVPLAVGVVHLGHHAGERAIGPVAPVDGQRVEHVPERARVRQHHHPAAAQFDAARGQEAVEVFPDAATRVTEVVTGAEAGQQPGARQVIEIDQPHVGAVAEHVTQRDRPGVGNPALVQHGGHQVPPSARAAWAPDRQPSSWKPQPW